LKLKSPFFGGACHRPTHGFDDNFMSPPGQLRVNFTSTFFDRERRQRDNVVEIEED